MKKFLEGKRFREEICKIYEKFLKISFDFSRCCCRWCRVARRSAELPPEIPRKRSSGKGLLKDDSGKGNFHHIH